MTTFQELVKLGDNEQARAEFCRRAILEFQNTEEYRIAADAEAYYHKHNVTIERYQKYLYTLSGKKMIDMYSANYKIKTLAFRRMVTQQVAYVLANGLILDEKNDKEKLSKDFDFKLQEAAKSALVGGKSFGFWNLDHLEVFELAETNAHPGFCPIYDENTGAMMAGIRFWNVRVSNSVKLNYTLYEADGYTNFVLMNDEYDISEKHPYKTIITGNAFERHEIGENYGVLPIFILYANDSHESELVGLRESIDCYDAVKSGLANLIDDASEIYWLIKNSGGMDDENLAQFIQRMKTVKAAVLEGDDIDATAETQEIPYEARKAMLEILRKDMYEDFQLLDINELSAAQKTTQEIRAAYQSQDNKCADFEYYLLDFVQKILDVAGITSAPSFKWNRIVNEKEQTETVLMAAQYLNEDIITRHLPFLTSDEIDEILQNRAAESIDRIDTTEDDENEGDE